MGLLDPTNALRYERESGSPEALSSPLSEINKPPLETSGNVTYSWQRISLISGTCRRRSQ